MFNFRLGTNSYGFESALPVGEDVGQTEVVVRGFGVEVEEVRDVEVALAERVGASRVGGPVVVDPDPLHVELQHQLPSLHVVQFGVGVNPGLVGKGWPTFLKSDCQIHAI